MNLPKRIQRPSVPNLNRLLWLFLMAAAASVRGADRKCEINVNIVYTDAGRKLPPPSGTNPSYYFPLVLGYREQGERVAGEVKPRPLPIIHALARALAAKGFVVISKEHLRPALLLTISWGYRNPEFSDELFLNQKEMLALLGAETLKNLDLTFEREAILQGAEDDRYFVVVTAYDFPAATRRQKIPLWQARMSTPSAGVTLDQVLPSLIAAGAPLFGAETKRPKWVMMPVRDGTVEVGEPKVLEYLDAPPAPEAPPPATKR